MLGLGIRHTDPISSSQGTPPFQLPIIAIEQRAIEQRPLRSKAKSRTEVHSNNPRRRGQFIESKYKIAKKNNKTFVDTQSTSKKNLTASQDEAVKAGTSKDSRHKSAERQELFDRHFSKVGKETL